MKFHIYDELMKKANTKKNNDKDLMLNKKYQLTIVTLPEEHREIVYTLILHHWLSTNNDISLIPYDGVVGKNGKGVTFDCEKFPSLLQKIIIEYINLISN